MSQDRITKYYLLCTVRMGGKAHMVSGLTSPQLGAVFTKKEVDLYLRPVSRGAASTREAVYTAREIVIGGGNGSTRTIGGTEVAYVGRGTVITGASQRTERKPIVFIM